MKTVTRKKLNGMSADQIVDAISESPLSIARYRESIGTLSLDEFGKDVHVLGISNFVAWNDLGENFAQTLQLSRIKRLPVESLPEKAAVICGYGEGKEKIIYWRKSR